MDFPNVLEDALTIIPTQTITYQKFLKNVINSVGNNVPQYADAQTADGSIQPAGASLLYKLGLANIPDLYVCYVRANVISLGDASSNDIIKDESGNIYNIIRTDAWFNYPAQDWNKIIIQRKKNYGNI